MTKHKQTANRVAVEAPSRIRVTEAAVRASAVTGAAVSADVVRCALREGKLEGCFKDGKWDIQVSDLLAWAEKRKEGKR